MRSCNTGLCPELCESLRISDTIRTSSSKVKATFCQCLKSKKPFGSRIAVLHSGLWYADIIIIIKSQAFSVKVLRIQGPCRAFMPATWDLTRPGSFIFPSICYQEFNAKIDIHSDIFHRTVKMRYKMFRSCVCSAIRFFPLRLIIQFG